jgi:protoheme IX farnesyltransferase
MARPLPSGEISSRSAAVISIALLTGGLLALVLLTNALAAALAAGAALWYNGAYTYLKRATGFAAIPGGLVGAIPPAVGWTAAGGAPFSPEIISLMAFMFVWQVPHFWLLLLQHRRDYDRVGFPAVTNVFAPAQLERVVLSWILAAAVSPMIIPIAGGRAYPVLLLLLGLTALWLVPHAAMRLGRGNGATTAGDVYVRLNVHALLVLTSLSAGAILGGIS